MKEKITRAGKFVNDHKLPILVISGIAIGVVIGYRYRAAAYAQMPGSIRINISAEEIQRMAEAGGGGFIHGDYDTGIFRTRMEVPPGM